MSGRLKRKLHSRELNPENDLIEFSKRYTKSKKVCRTNDTEQESSLHVKKLKTVENETIVTEHRRCTLPRSFYDKPCIDLAKGLLGKNFYHLTGCGEEVCGRIVETEAYPGGENERAPSYHEKRIAKNETTSKQPGIISVCNIQDEYCCINISGREQGAAVLIRSLEPLQGQETMRKFRTCNKSKKKGKCRFIEDRDLCNGPSKLCQAFDINKEMVNGQDLTTSKKVWLEEGDVVSGDKIVNCKRRGVNYAGHWGAKTLRYYILGSKCVTKRDRKVEKSLLTVQ